MHASRDTHNREIHYMPRIVKMLIAVVVGIPLLGIGAAYCGAGLTSQRVSGNEASAVGSLRAIVSAQMVHAATCDGGYAPTLERLASLGHLSADLAGDPTVKSGYIVALQRADGAQDVEIARPECQGAISGFTATAVPLEPGSSGVRFFRVADAGTVEQATDAAFTDSRALE